MPAGIVPFEPEHPWQNIHENFKHQFAKNASWEMTHADEPNMKAGELYRRATDNMKWAIGNAIDKTQTLRAIGAGWSLSPVATCSGGMLQTKGLDLIFNVKPEFLVKEYTDKGKTEAGVKLVECGVQIARLNNVLEVLSDPPRCIRASGGSNGQSVAGATATGTHGAALYTGAVHDAIIGIHLVTGRDTHVWIERESYPVATDAFLKFLGNPEPKRSDELFNAAVVSFGAFGIVHGLLFETEPLFLLKEYRVSNFAYTDELMNAFATLDMAKLRALLPEIPESKPGHELYHMEINMNPYAVKKGSQGGMHVFMFFKVPVPPGYRVDHAGDNPTGPSPEFISIMKNLQGVLGNNHLTYEVIKSATSREFDKNIRPATPQPRTIGGIFRDTRFTGNIASFALAVSASDLPATIEQILEEISHNAFAGAVAVRFVKGTEATLGFTRFDHTCVVEMDGMDNAQNHQVFANVIQRLENRNIIVTIHWGKLNSPLNPDRVNRGWTKKKVQEWKRSREALLKPETRDVFNNVFMQACGLDSPSEVIV